MKGPELKQQSAEWLAWRRQGIGGSDAAAIMGVSPWTTALELWRMKCGLAPEPEVNAAMRRGTAMEPVARAAYEKATGNIVEPYLVVHDEYDFIRASLDGLSFDGDLAIEIKCPGRSAHNEAKEGQVPNYYLPQVHHILMVTDAKRLDYWSFDGEDGVLVPVYPDAEYQAELLEKERAFWDCVVNKTPPKQPAYEGVAEIVDATSVTLAASYQELVIKADQAVAAAERVKSQLLHLCKNAVNKIGPLTISRVRGRLSLDRDALKQAGVDLDKFQKRGGDFWKVAIGK